MAFGDYLYQLGLIDTNARELFHEKEKQGRAYIKKRLFKSANDVFSSLIDMYQNLTGLNNYFNFLQQDDHSLDANSSMLQFLNRTDIRNAIHVGSLPFKIYNYDVGDKLENELMDTAAPYLSELLNHYRILIYNGQMDVIVAYPLTVNFLQNLAFKNSEDYKKALRKIWRVGSDVDGFVHEAGKLVDTLCPTISLSGLMISSLGLITEKGFRNY